ncbi:alpha/beta-hydrolase [Corynespora cassiicola Philippines]|uniref:Carboxylic ester hydrolase n=1 Tax=Corynespora cassiicola Philippines TaxID=1448308 RepID=A0A2T2N1K5_CORCC|nr:alpha/beta-hydrolase [Corynespora cassiicola Philippines]
MAYTTLSSIIFMQSSPAQIFARDGLFSGKNLVLELGYTYCRPRRTFFGAQSSQPIVTTTNGTLIGVQNLHYGQELFLGIPYAQPPVGDLRYNHPQPLNRSWGRRTAATYGPWCHSASLSLPGYSQSGFPHEESEDCLTLNIVRPSGLHEGSKIPVLVWIYGGGFQEGGSADQRNNMSFLVQESVNMEAPIIGISFNYRLSGFGFLSGRAVHKSGIANLGLHDQRLALRWVQDNIDAFGGDPSRVTIQGQSAGAMSVGHHFLAYGGRDDGLFRAGIAESGAPQTGSPLISLDQQDGLYESILRKTNCTSSIETLQCLRSKDANVLKAAFQEMSFFPVIDGAIIADFPSVALKEGRFVKKPLLIGTNTNEGTAFSAYGGFGVNSTAEFRAVVTGFGQGLTNATTTAIVNEYINVLSSEEAQRDLSTVRLAPSSRYGSLYGRTTLYVGDLLFTAGKRYTTEQWARYGAPVYSYRFDVVPGNIDPETLGATHYQEIPFVFRNFDGIGHSTNPLASNFTEMRQKYIHLSNLMSRMWLSFVTDLSPNLHGGNPLLTRYIVSDFNLKWPIYNEETATNVVFDLDNIHLEADTWRSGAISRLVSAYKELRV